MLHWFGALIAEMSRLMPAGLCSSTSGSDRCRWIDGFSADSGKVRLFTARVTEMHTPPLGASIYFAVRLGARMCSADSNRRKNCGWSGWLHRPDSTDPPPCHRQPRRRLCLKPGAPLRRLYRGRCQEHYLASPTCAGSGVQSGQIKGLAQKSPLHLWSWFRH